MTRLFLIIAGLGALASAICFALVFAVGPVQWDVDWGGHGARIEGGGPVTVRELDWPGVAELTVNVPADITYVQGPDAKVLVTGPKGAVDHLSLDGDGALGFDARVRPDGRLQIAVTAPGVREFTLNGSGRLDATGLDQDQLSFSLRGSGRVRADGKAKRVEVEILGSGDADLAELAVDDAEVRIAGSGDATVGPEHAAKVEILGSGDVKLTKRPQSVDSQIHGSGRVVQPNEEGKDEDA